MNKFASKFGEWFGRRKPVCPDVTDSGDYIINESGDKLPKATVNKIDVDRFNTVVEIAAVSKAMAAELYSFKKEIAGILRDFVNRSAADSGVKKRKKLGNLSLIGPGGLTKVEVCIQRTEAFNEKLDIAKDIIDECLERWGADSDQNLMAIIGDVFNVRSDGSFNVRSVMSLKKHNISDPEWKRAMSILDKSVLYLFSKSYFRVYERNNVEKAWQQIPLDFSRIVLDEVEESEDDVKAE